MRKIDKKPNIYVIRKLILFFLGIAFLAHCGGGFRFLQPEKESVSVSVEETKNLGLSATVTNVQMAVDGCVSQHTTTFDNTATSIDLIMYDQNCVASVTSFDIDSETFTIKAGETFQYGVGQVTIFEAPSGKQALVIVIQQLPPLLTPGAGSSIEFEIFQLKNSTGVINVNPNHNIVQVVADQSSASEDTAGSVSFTVNKIAEKAPGDLTVYYSVIGSVTAGSDYTVPSGSVVIPNGQSSASFSVTLINDNINEANEVLSILIGTGDYLSYGLANTVITDTDSNLPSGSIFHLDSFTYDASNQISSWNDSTGNGLHAVNAIINQMPLVQAGIYNGNDSAIYDGSNDVLSIPSSPLISSGGPYTGKSLFILFKTSSDITRRQLIYDEGDRDRGINIYLDQDKLYFNLMNLIDDDAGATTPWGPLYITANVSIDQMYSISLVFDQTNSKISAYFGGVKIGELTENVGKLFSSGDATGFGNSEGNVRFHDQSINSNTADFSGEIIESIYYDVALTENDVRSIHDYLDNKYDNSIPVIGVNALTQTVAEGFDTYAVFNIQRSFVSANPLTVDLVIGGTATANADYIDPLTPQVTIPAFSDSVTYKVYLKDDTEAETPETITLTVSENAGYKVPGEPASVDLKDDETFDPTPGLGPWFAQFEGIQLEGSLVTQWDDKTTNAFNAFQSTSNKKPFYDNTDGSVLFDGSNDYLEVTPTTAISSATSYEAKTFAVAFEVGADATSKQTIFEQGTTKIGFNIYIENNTLYFAAYNANRNDATTPWGPESLSYPIVANALYVAIYEFDFANTQIRGRVNNFSIGSVSTGIGRIFDHSSGAISLGRVLSGARFHDNSTTNGGNYFGGKILEFMHFNEILSASNLSSLESYLINKYSN